jgi:hypothetical protein
MGRPSPKGLIRSAGAGCVLTCPSGLGFFIKPPYLWLLFSSILPSGALLMFVDFCVREGLQDFNGLVPRYPGSWRQNQKGSALYSQCPLVYLSYDWRTASSWESLKESSSFGMCEISHLRDSTCVCPGCFQVSGFLKVWVTQHQDLYHKLLWFSPQKNLLCFVNHLASHRGNCCFFF